MSHYRPKDGKDGIPGADGKDGARGPIGPMPEHEWIGTNLRFQEPSGEWGEFVDLEGPKGEQGNPGSDGRNGVDGADGRDGARGPKGDKGNDGENGRDGDRGPIGPMPDHQWRGTSLRFQEPDGDWGKPVDLKGEKGDPGAPGLGGRTRAAGDGTTDIKPIQYNNDLQDHFGASADLGFDPVGRVLYLNGSQRWPGKVFVTKKSDLPAAIAGVITLEDNVNYEFSDAIDLLGDRIVLGANNSFFGQTADADALYSTGLSPGDALITGSSSLDIRNLRLSAPTGRLFDLNDGAGNSLNWSGVQIIDTPVIGTIKNYANIVTNECIASNSANLTLDGTIASFVSQTSLWDGRPGQSTIIVAPTCVFTRRFRMLYTAVTVQPGEIGINFSTSANIPDESYILDNVNFSGGGTYLSGLNYDSNKASFFRCFGITNTNAICQYSMTGNVTATVIPAMGTFVKIAGTTVANALNQKFSTGTTNRATYTGAFPADFGVSVNASMVSGNNQNIRMRIAKNGVTIPESNSSFITTGFGDASAIPTQTLTTLVPTDYLEVWVANDTATTNITVTDLNVIVRRFS